MYVCWQQLDATGGSIYLLCICWHGAGGEAACLQGNRVWLTGGYCLFLGTLHYTRLAGWLVLTGSYLWPCCTERFAVSLAQSEGTHGEG